MALLHLRGSTAILLLVLLLILLLSTTAQSIKVNNPFLKPSSTSTSSTNTVSPSSYPSSNDCSSHSQDLARPSFDTQLSTLSHLHTTLAQWRTTTIRNTFLQKSVHLHSIGYISFGSMHHNNPKAHLTGDFDRLVDLDVASSMVARIHGQIKELEQELRWLGCEEHVLRQAAAGSSGVEVMEEWIR